MNGQTELPDMRQMTVIVPAKRRTMLLLDMGAQGELLNLVGELEALQKQHPSVAGITLALAVANKRIAVVHMRTTRTVLTIAAIHGMPIENHGISSSVEGDEIVLHSLPD